MINAYYIMCGDVYLHSNLVRWKRDCITAGQHNTQLKTFLVITINREISVMNRMPISDANFQQVLYSTSLELVNSYLHANEWL